MTASPKGLSRCVVAITPQGNLGNQMIQFMLARALAARVTNLEITGYDMPLWNLSAPGTNDTRRAVTVDGHFIDVNYLARLFRLGLLRNLELRGYGFRMANFLSPEDYQRDFTSTEHVDGFGDDELVINVRGAEVIDDCHPDYGPVPLSYYRQVIQETGLRPVFIGQLGDDYYSQVLRAEFPTARFVPSRGPLVDFQTIRNSRNIVLAVSSFSWLAGWLSTARRIYMPLLGFLNPQQRPDINLLPIDDERYVFYDFPERKWIASAEQKAELFATSTYPMTAKAELQRRLERAQSAVCFQRWRAKARIAANAMRQRLHV